MSSKDSNETKPTAVSAPDPAPANPDGKHQPTASEIEIPNEPQVVPKNSFFSSAFHKAQSAAAAGKAFITSHMKAEFTEVQVEEGDATKNTKVLKVSQEISEEDPDKPEAKQLGAHVEESCLLFPSYATKSCPEGETEEEATWYVKIKGWAFSGGQITKSETILLDVTRHMAGISADSEAGKILEQNASYFFKTSVKDTPFKIESLGLVDVEKMEISGANYLTNFIEHLKEDRCSVVVNSGAGHFDGVLKIPASTVEKLAKSRGTKLLKIQAIQDNLDKPSFGVVLLIDDTEGNGVSVISDIDDTIKATGILDGIKIVFANTFLHAPNPVEGMSDVYRHFSAAGVPHHYVSNGPWQLFPMLSAFFRESSFPPGSAHLRLFDLRTARAVPGQHKLTVIPELMKDFPTRKFILIGDTGELDPEVYTKIARLYPDHVLKIFIHDVTTDKVRHLPPIPHRHYTLKVLEGEVEHIVHLVKQKDDDNTGLDLAEDLDILKTPLEVFHERIEKLTKDLPSDLFTLFTDPNVILNDPLVKKALPTL